MKRILSIALILVLILSVSVTAFAEDKTNIDFTATDISGEEWNTQSLKDYRLIMFNMWEDWCGPCMGEIPDLELLYQKYKDEGFLLIGLTRTDPSSVEEIVEKLGLSYPMLSYTEDFAFLETGYIPATFFTDSEGNLFTHEVTNSYDTEFTYIGGREYDDWDEIIKEHLDQIPDELPVIPLNNPCTLTFLDTDGNAVPGVKVQICTESLCTLHESDAKGIIKYTEKQEAEAHIISLPDGYKLGEIVEGKKEIKIILK